MTDFALVNFYFYDVSASTRYDIIDSVLSFSADNTVFPAASYMTLRVTAPVEDVGGTSRTLTKGDMIWPSFYRAAVVGSVPEQTIVPFAGYITEVVSEGETLVVTAESLARPFLDSTFSGTYASSTPVKDIIEDIIDDYTSTYSPGIGISYDFVAYCPTTGGGSYITLATTEDTTLSDNRISQIFQYFSEFPAVDAAIDVGILSVAYPSYSTNAVSGKPDMVITWTGYGQHPTSGGDGPYTLSYDSGLISMVNWVDGTDTVLNDVTVTVNGGGTYQKTDATSIADYGQRATTLLRSIYSTTTPAEKHADTIVAAMKDPKPRCSADVEARFIFSGDGGALAGYPGSGWAGKVNGVYTVIDDVTGKSEEMVLRSYTIYYPSNVVRCEFDNAALNLSNYGVRLENRVSNLESNLVTAHSGFYDIQGGQSGQYYHLNSAAYNNLYQQDQGVKTTSSPTFADINATGVYKMDSTTIIDSSKNLSNIGTVTATKIHATSNGASDNYRVGDDAFIGDCNTANMLSVCGYTAGSPNANGGIIFGTGKDTNLYRSGANILKTDDAFQANSYAIGSTAVIDSSGNLSNIGTVGCGAITAGGSAVINATGYVDQPKNLMCSAYASSGTALAGSTWVKIDLAAEEYDTNSTFASDRFTAPVAGKYLVCYGLGIASLAADKFFYADVVKNCTGGNYTTSGTAVIRAQSVGGGTHVIGASKILVLAANDYLELWGYHNDSSSRNTRSGASESYMSVHYLGA